MPINPLSSNSRLYLLPSTKMVPLSLKDIFPPLWMISAKTLNSLIPPILSLFEIKPSSSKTLQAFDATTLL